MFTFRIKERATICLPLLLLFVACTTTITKTQSPVFAKPIDSLQARLNGLVVCRNINMNGKEVTTNGKRNSQLEIDIFNAKDIPEDNGRMKALAHSLAVEVKEALKDKNEYDNYTVLFVKVDSSSSIIKQNWRGNSFKSTEL